MTTNHEEKRLPGNPAGQDPDAADPVAANKLRLQKAIFEVTLETNGKSMADIRGMLTTAFARHGVEPPPGTWLDSVASAAYYGEPYIIDMPSALAADDAVSAPDADVRRRLDSRRELRNVKLPPGTLPEPSAWELSPDEVTTVTEGPAQADGTARKTGPSRPLLAAAGIAAAVGLVAAVTRSSRRRTGKAVPARRGGAAAKG